MHIISRERFFFFDRDAAIGVNLVIAADHDGCFTTSYYVLHSYAFELISHQKKNNTARAAYMPLIYFYVAYNNL